MSSKISNEAGAETRTDLTKAQFDDLVAFIRNYYRDELGEFVQKYPNDTTHFEISYSDIKRGVTLSESPGQSFAEQYITTPKSYDDDLTAALDHAETLTEMDLGEATVAVVDLPEWCTYYPGEFSPKDEAGHYRAVTGEIARATDVYVLVQKAAFECQRCGTITQIPQPNSDFQEPHECNGCERQGPFEINLDRSELIDAQMLRLQTPPEIAQIAGQEIDVYLEGEELVDTATVGDRVTVTGTIHLEQQSNGRNKTPKFDPILEARHVELEESDHTEIDISPEERNRIQELAAGAEGKPIDVAGESLHPRVYGHETVKEMLVLAMVGGAGPGDIRGEFHMLLLGDPGTAKSDLLDRVEEIAPRSVGVSGKGATEAGVTASAVQDDFGDGNAATLKAGALVKANSGIVCIDELDDMPSDVRAAMLGPMSKQRIHVNKWGINARLSTETAVVAAGNPKHGRFDTYEPLADQFDLEANLLSRFDLIYTFLDELDEERDAAVADRILTARNAQKRQSNGEALGESEQAAIEGPISTDLLRKWIALAKQQPDPVFANEEVKETLKEQFTTIRGMYGYSDDEPVPVTFRKLPATVRIAEAAAKFEFSETIEARHAKIATQAVGESMRDYGRDEEGNYDADIQETGSSMAQKERLDTVTALIAELQQEHDSGDAPIELLEEQAAEEGIDKQGLHHTIDKLKNTGQVYEPAENRLKYVGK